MIDERIDIGIRIGPAIKDERFIARSIGKFSFAIVATPELLTQYGKPTSIDDLNNKPLVALADVKTEKLWFWPFINKIKFTPIAPKLICDDAQTELNAVLNHVGIGRIPKCLAQPYIDSGELISVLDELTVEGPWDVFIYRPQRGPVPHRIRVLFDFFNKALNFH
ncbi:substrate binding domain-containing protein [Celerinatantimonas sp. MCCC 1A17872]|uniref:substrate binding domain-containing protein n=1 Tax=Celerinatantimonas sp. MCCC 1A17872 TaxID=3177514 RepID=UPI0038CB8B21